VTRLICVVAVLVLLDRDHVLQWIEKLSPEFAEIIPETPEIVPARTGTAN
jgi:hypothetical protein